MSGGADVYISAQASASPDSTRLAISCADNIGISDSISSGHCALGFACPLYCQRQGATSQHFCQVAAVGCAGVYIGGRVNVYVCGFGCGADCVGGGVSATQ